MGNLMGQQISDSTPLSTPITTGTWVKRTSFPHDPGGNLALYPSPSISCHFASVSAFDLSEGENVLKVASTPSSRLRVGTTIYNMLVCHRRLRYISFTDAVGVSTTRRYGRSAGRARFQWDRPCPLAMGTLLPWVTLTERLSSESVRRSLTLLGVTDPRSLYMSCTDALGKARSQIYRG